MLYKYIVSNLFFFLSCFLFAQENFIIRGKITNNDAKPISFATIQLINTNTKKVISFSISDSQGNYSIKVNNQGNYILEISHVNYSKISETLQVNESYTTKDVILESKEKEIEEVVIISKAITAKEDTISYNLNSFTNGHEEKLKDILNKLPGIEVENGNIKVNGKQVDKLLVDGKDFFGNNHKIATENLNAQMIKSVEILNNYKSSQIAKNIEGGNQTALNVGIKKEYKNKITGEASLLSAYESKYNAQLNLFKFTNNLSISFIGNANNTGQESFTIDDYLKLNLDVRNDLMNSELSSFKEMDNFLPNFLLSDNNVIKKENQMGSINLSYLPSEKIKITGFTLLNNTWQREKILSERTFLNSNFHSIDNNNSKGNFLFNQTHVKIDFEINKNNSLNYSVSIEPTKDHTDREISQESYEKILFNENMKNRNMKFGQQISYLSKIAKNKLITFNIYQESNSSKGDFFLLSSHSLYDFNINNLVQNSTKKNREWGVIGKYSQNIGEIVVRNSMGYLWKQNFFKNSIIENNIKNHISFHTDYSFIKPAILKNKNFLQFLLDFELRNYNLKLNTHSSNSLFFLPQVKIKLEFKQTHTLALFYKREVDYISADKLNAYEILLNYSSIYKESFIKERKEIINNTIGLEYLFLNLFDGNFLSANVNYSRKANSPITNSSVNSQYTILNYISLSDQDIWNTFVNFEKKLKFIKYKLKINVNYNFIKSSTFTNFQEIPMNTNRVNGDVSFQTYNKKSIVNYDFGSKFSYLNTDYKNQDISLKNSQIIPFVNLYFNFGESLKFSLKNSYEFYKSGSISRDKYNLGLKVIYRKEHTPWKFWIEGYDILNISGSEIVETSTDDNILQKEIYHKLPGYAGIGISYSL